MRRPGPGGFWDAHACLPLTKPAALAELARHRLAGCRVVGVNVGFDGMAPEATMASLARFADDLAAAGDELQDVTAALADGDAHAGLGVYFDIEGADVLESDLDRLDRLAELGLRSLVLVYNRANAAGGGCHDVYDTGLTEFGRRIVERQNRLGVIVDASHCSPQTSLDMCRVSSTPVIFSHSNCRALVDHPRNVTDDQIRAVAATGGVVGINGSSLFLGTSDWAPAIVEHVRYVIDLVGVEHVGVGLDYVYDLDDLAQLVDDAPGLFPGRQYDEVTFCPPDLWPEIESRLARDGLGESDLGRIRWNNFARVARATFDDL